MPSNILHGPRVESTLSNISLGDFFFNYAQKYASNIFQINADTDESESYASACQRSIRLALLLQKKEITSADVIVTCCQNTIDSVIPAISAMFLGAKIANLDPSLSARDITYLLELTTPKIIFVSSSCAELVKRCWTKSKIIVIESFFPKLRVPQLDEDQFKPVKTNVHDVAWILFSSGTTGFPKGICHSHYSILQVTELFAACNFDTRVSMHFTTLYWISAVFITTAAFLQGGTKVSFSNIADGEAVFRVIEKYQVTYLFTAPVNTYNLTNVKNISRFHIPVFCHLMTAGTSISNNQLKKLESVLNKTQTFHCYGQTEVGVVTAFNSTTSKDVIHSKIDSSGNIAINTSLKIVDIKNEETLEPYQTGEIRIKAPSCFVGYYKQDSSASFDVQGFLKTGDLGYVDLDGYLYVVGRSKEMFKYKSWHIVPASIESVLMEHPSVKECIVYGIPAAEDLGEIPAAAVIVKEDATIGASGLEEYVASKVLDREKLRGGLKIVKSLPRTATGKIQRTNIREFVEKLFEI